MLRRLMGRYLKPSPRKVTVTRLDLPTSTPLIRATPATRATPVASKRSGNDRNGAFPLRNSEGLTFAEARQKRLDEEAVAMWLGERGVTFFGE